MIKVNKGQVEIKGDEALIMSELSTLIFAMHDDKILSKSKIEKCIKDGFKSEEEIKRELARKFKEHSGDSFIDAMKELIVKAGILEEEDFQEEEKSETLKDLLRKLNEQDDEEE